MLDEPHPFLDFMSLAIVLLAAVSYGLDGIFGFNPLRWVDFFPPTLAIVVGLSGIWQIIRQTW